MFDRELYHVLLLLLELHKACIEPATLQVHHHDNEDSQNILHTISKGSEFTHQGKIWRKHLALTPKNQTYRLQSHLTH